MGGMGAYLGIPESLGGPKTQVFSFLKDRLLSRINGWTPKLLSKGGKEVMIKSVATALPTYIMSCFRVPKKVTTKLISAVSQFWWSSGGSSRGMHWLSWEKLCRKKIDGGLGFRLLQEFNTALLAKQLWRLMDHPSSLFARVFKGRYFRNSDPLAPIRSYSPSYGWRSIISARSLVRKGLIKRVDTGASISVWNDPWIPAHCPRPALPKTFVQYPHLCVNHLIDERTMTWKVDLVKDLLCPEDAAIVQGIPISRLLRSDRDGWHFTKSGRYTVKSEYNVKRESQLANKGPLILGPDIKPLQAFTWMVKCPPKLRHFMWQVVSGCLPVLGNLKARRIQCDAQCGRCGVEVETINHVLFECPPALQVWALSSVPSNPAVFPTGSVFTNMDYLFWRIPSDDHGQAYPWLLWYIWKGRNDKCFNNIDRSAVDIVRMAEAEASVWTEAQCMEGSNISGEIVRNSLLSQPTGQQIGQPVQAIQGRYCQVDGSWKAGDVFSGQGWITECAESEVMMGARNVRCSLSPLHAEFEALIWAMDCMSILQFKEVTFASDCLELVKLVSEPMLWPAFAVHLEEFQRAKSAFGIFALIHIPRSTNSRADKLARSARSFHSCIIHVGVDVPTWLVESF